MCSDTVFSFLKTNTIALSWTAELEVNIRPLALLNNEFKNLFFPAITVFLVLFITTCNF